MLWAVVAGTTPPPPQNWGEGRYYTVGGDTLSIVAADFCVRPNVVAQ